MTTIDDAKIIHDILDTEWNINNVAKPVFYYKGDVKNHDYRTDGVKIYLRSLTRKTADVTYSYHEIRAGVTVDIRTSSRDRMLALRDETNRCLNVYRAAPDANYNLILFDGENIVSEYAGFFHYVINITLINHGRLITTT